VAAAAGAMSIGINFRPSDVLISYMPYSHMFERMMLTMAKLSGCAVGFMSTDVNLLNDI
jgi:long-subunit acyl-CoA synthetase (AMP-forming)